ncbi:MAG: GNAT family N-acetyltransferase [Chloroflexi bacterium]|nr:GNAT family N-acetyltransferase [Chloroflexota bacterium]
METRWEGKRKLSGFNVRRLPRVLTLHPPLDPDDLHADWRNGDLFLVAEVEQVIVGYLDMLSPRRLGTGLLQCIVVRPDLRRRGVGSALLRTSLNWAKHNQLQGLCMDVQSRNYPAIQFLNKNGFVYSGYNDRYYPTQDVALFFDYRLGLT